MGRKGDSYIGGHSIYHGTGQLGMDRPSYGKPIDSIKLDAKGRRAIKGKKLRLRKEPKPLWMRKMEEVDKAFRAEKRRGRRGKTVITGVVLPDLTGGGKRKPPR